MQDLRKSFGQCISTHSLTRRLTGMKQKVFMTNKYFNSQPHKEADSDNLVLESFVIHFNSQPHKEADKEETVVVKRVSISTHSLTRRLTELSDTQIMEVSYFNSQPHKEADVAGIKEVQAE